MDERLSTTVWRIPALRFRSGRTRMIRPWQRNGRWSPQEAAAELHRRRAGLIGQLRRRSEARGVPAGAQEEIVDDAITAVVMAPRGVANEHHLLGAFWLAVDHRCRRHREGRHFTRLGSRRRVEFDLAAQKAPDGANPFDSAGADGQVRARCRPDGRPRPARASGRLRDGEQRGRPRLGGALAGAPAGRGAFCGSQRQPQARSRRRHLRRGAHVSIPRRRDRRRRGGSSKRG